MNFLYYLSGRTADPEDKTKSDEYDLEAQLPPKAIDPAIFEEGRKMASQDFTWEAPDPSLIALNLGDDDVQLVPFSSPTSTTSSSVITFLSGVFANWTTAPKTSDVEGTQPASPSRTPPPSPTRTPPTSPTRTPPPSLPRTPPTDRTSRTKPNSRHPNAKELQILCGKVMEALKDVPGSDEAPSNLQSFMLFGEQTVRHVTTNTLPKEFSDVLKDKVTHAKANKNKNKNNPLSAYVRDLYILFEALHQFCNQSKDDDSLVDTLRLVRSVYASVSFLLDSQPTDDETVIEEDTMTDQDYSVILEETILFFAKVKGEHVFDLLHVCTCVGLTLTGADRINYDKQPSTNEQCERLRGAIRLFKANDKEQQEFKRHLVKWICALLDEKDTKALKNEFQISCGPSRKIYLGMVRISRLVRIRVFRWQRSRQ